MTPFLQRKIQPVFFLCFSEDKGETWTDIKTPLFSGDIDDFYIEGNSIYVLSGTSTEPINHWAMFFSKDKGLTWEKNYQCPRRNKF